MNIEEEYDFKFTGGQISTLLDALIYTRNEYNRISSLCNPNIIDGWQQWKFFADATDNLEKEIYKQLRK